LATPGRRTSTPRVAFVYPSPRGELAAEVAHGRAPDTTLLGQNHLGLLGLPAEIHDPALTLRGPAALERVLWNLREVSLPWELGGTDVVFTPLAALFPLAARARRRPSVVVVNYGLCTSWERSSTARRRLLGASLRSAAAVVCLGSSQRDLLLRQTGISPRRVATVRLGVDERYHAPQPLPDSEPLVLAVGKDLARDYATFGEAVGTLGVRTVIACLPRNLEGIRLPPNVRARFVGPAELRRLYGEAACVVLPQRPSSYPYGSEGGGLTALLEAMATARPVVASDRPILHDYVEDEGSALLVPPEEPEPLRAAIERVLADRALASSLGTAARRRVEERFTTRLFAQGLAPILRAAVRRDPNAHRIRAQ
jgi:glycosyltransferase involved in cell wall biosynthesis